MRGAFWVAWGLFCSIDDAGVPRSVEYSECPKSAEHAVKRLRLLFLHHDVYFSPFGKENDALNLVLDTYTECSNQIVLKKRNIMFLFSFVHFFFCATCSRKEYESLYDVCRSKCEAGFPSER